MIDSNLQFEREKLKLDVSVLSLSKGNYRYMREEMAKLIVREQ